MPSPPPRSSRSEARSPLRTRRAPTLNGTVGPGFTITLKQNGKAVKSLKAGSYTFVVADKADIHDFVLGEVEGRLVREGDHRRPVQGDEDGEDQADPGTWEFYCRPHESQMKGTFTVK